MWFRNHVSFTMSGNEKLTDNELREKVSTFLRKNFPQIQMHGGSSDIIDVDAGEGSVHIVLSGACSGCGISPMTVEAIKSRLYADVDTIESIEVETGMDSLYSQSNNSVEDNKQDDDDTEIQAPF